MAWMPALSQRLARLVVPALLVLSTGTAAAVAPTAGRAPIVATSAAKAPVPLRQGIDVRADVPPVRQHAWDRFVGQTGGRWRATWDRATGVPSRLWGGSVYVPGASASPALAELAARAFLAAHGDLLAPGVSSADLVLVANHDDGRIRSVGFRQMHDGMLVAGGQISVRFLNDRLYVVSSQIVPIGAGDVAKVVVRDHRALAGEALAATTRDLALARASARAESAAVILPLIADDRVLGFRVALPVDVDAGTAGHWMVYTDAATGEPLVRVDHMHRADGTLLYDVPIRYPAGGRVDIPAARAKVTVDGAAVTTSDAGALSWAREAVVPLVTSVSGDLVQVRNTPDDTAIEATRSLMIGPAGTARWSEPLVPLHDAQISAFVHVQIVKAFVRSITADPSVVAYLDLPIVATVNLDDVCNAFYTRDNDGNGTINFFVASEQCENSARVADVIYHEFGHGVHDYSIIAGVGLFDGAMSEGAADFLAALVTGDHGMGRGFFYTDEPLRDLDEADRERVWPDDVGEIHTTGMIFGGAFWDLRTAAIGQLGEAAGIALTERLFLGTLKRATDIPSALIEALATDDDDGDLGNGTPHECLIREAFGRHGLRTVAALVDAPGQVQDTAAVTTPVSVSITGLSATCLGDEIDHVALEWGNRPDSDSPATGTANLTATGADVYSGDLVLPEPGDVVTYRFKIYYSDGTSQAFPDNIGDPSYELHRGALIDLFCTDFETDPFASGWTHGSSGTGPDLWQWGVPVGAGGDPADAYSGDNVLGMAIDAASGGVYVPKVNTWVKSPAIDTGHYSDVRLQFRRWLGVEDGFYDKATIWANGEIAWQNLGSGQSLDASKHTRDHEWVFRDVPLSAHIANQSVELQFDLASDEGLEFGGWTLDDLCVVADPNAICGDGTINGYEQCDDGDGNADASDACRLNCRRPACGDGIVDGTEGCDDGNIGDADGCSAICTVEDDGGCCSANDDPAAALAPLAMIGAALLLRRRRRRA